MIKFIFNFQEKRKNTKMAKLNTTEHTFVEVIEIKKEEESTVDLNDPLNFNNDFRIKEEKEVDEFNDFVLKLEVVSMVDTNDKDNENEDQLVTHNLNIIKI